MNEKVINHQIEEIEIDQALAEHVGVAEANLATMKKNILYAKNSIKKKMDARKKASLAALVVFNVAMRAYSLTLKAIEEDELYNDEGPHEALIKYLEMGMATVEPKGVENGEN